MIYFEKYVSNTLAGSANQSWFESDGNVLTGRVFYKVFAGGKFNYSFLFTNIIDSTFSDGTHSHRNLVCDQWEIVSASVCVCEKTENESCKDFKIITFGGEKSKTVMPGEFFATDAVEIVAEKDEYICLQLQVKGKMMPYHHEIIIPVFVKEGNEWKENVELPVPAMVGCDRTPKLRVGFLGDSITQGIGTEVNSYKHWNAVLADMLGEENSYWNLGIGFARGNDAATDGAWLFKAKQTDAVVVCVGVNDTCRGHSAELIKSDIKTIVQKLRNAGCRVLVQTLPPFDVEGEKEKTRIEVNRFILNELDADAIFDNNTILADGNRSVYGGHANAEGCKKWAEALCPVMEEFLSGK